MDSKSDGAPASSPDKLAKRLARAAKDKERKRAARGGLKDSPKKYKEWLGSLTEDERAKAQYLLEYQHSFAIEPGSLTPISLDLLRRCDEAGGRLELPKPPPIPERPLPKKLSQNSSAVKQRRPGFTDFYCREEIAQFKAIPPDRLKMIIEEIWPGDYAEKLAHLQSVIADDEAYLNKRKKAKREKQALYRDKNIEKIRPSELKRTKARRSREKELRQNAPFVAIDAEGCDVGGPIGIDTDADWMDLGLPERASPGSKLGGGIGLHPVWERERSCCRSTDGI